MFSDTCHAPLVCPLVHHKALGDLVVEQILLECLQSEGFIFLGANLLLSGRVCLACISLYTLHHIVKGSKVVRMLGQLLVDVSTHFHDRWLLTLFLQVFDLHIELCRE